MERKRLVVVVLDWKGSRHCGIYGESEAMFKCTGKDGKTNVQSLELPPTSEGDHIYPNLVVNNAAKSVMLELERHGMKVICKYAMHGTSNVKEHNCFYY